MTPELERRAISFIRTIANRCERCLRRTPENCRNCPSAWANEIMADYENDGRPPAVDYTLAARELRILEALRTSGRPLSATEIDLSDICSRALKHWTLCRMVRTGRLVRQKISDHEGRKGRYLYFIPNNKNKGTTK